MARRASPRRWCIWLDIKSDKWIDDSLYCFWSSGPCSAFSRPKNTSFGPLYPLSAGQAGARALQANGDWPSPRPPSANNGKGRARDNGRAPSRREAFGTLEGAAGNVISSGADPRPSDSAIAGAALVGPGVRACEAADRAEPGRPGAVILRHPRWPGRRLEAREQLQAEWTSTWWNCAMAIRMAIVSLPLWNGRTSVRNRYLSSF